MVVLAIDPGYDRLGVAVLDCSLGMGKERLVFSDCVETNSADDFSKRLRNIFEAVEEIISAHKPDALAIETLYLATNKKTAMRVAEARGVVLLACERAGLGVFEYSPPEIKVAVTGHGGSDKTQIADMVRRLIRFEKKDVRDDELDAVAIGLTHSALARRNSLG